MSSDTTTTPLPRLAASAEEAGEMLGISRSLLLAMDRTGELGPQSRKLGGRRLWSVAELDAWCRAGMPPRSRWVEMWAMIRKGATS